MLESLLPCYPQMLYDQGISDHTTSIMDPTSQSPGSRSSLSSGQLCSAGPHVTALCSGGTLTERGVARVISELSQPSQKNLSVGLSLLDMNPGSILSPQSRASSCIPQPDWLLLKSYRDYGHQRLKEYI